MIITIDGKTATGKSTIAKRLAREIGFIYFDTGAMYRSLAYGVLKEGVNWQDEAALLSFLKDFNFQIKIRHGEKTYFYKNEDITLKIRDDAVTRVVSKIAALKPVRNTLIKIQKEWAEGVNAVFEGRDMGTVVFPDAELKIFLTASAEVRAKRRFDELCEKFPEKKDSFKLEEVLEDMKERDTLDENREYSPLKKAEDAFEIDTSNLSLDDIIFRILECKASLKTRSAS